MARKTNFITGNGMTLTLAKSGDQVNITHAVTASDSSGNYSITGTLTVSGGAVTLSGGALTQSGGTASFTGGNVDITKSTNAELKLTLSNTSNTSSAYASYYAIVAGATAQDPKMVFRITGTYDAAIGLDNSDSDKFKISMNSNLGTADALRVDLSTNALEFPGTTSTSFTGANVDITRSYTNAVSLTISNTANSASATAVLNLKCGGTSANDAYAVFQISGGQSYSIGLDNSASDAFVISASATLGTTNAISITTAGAVSFPTGDVTVTGRTISGKGFSCNSTTPSIAAGTGAGTSPTISITGNDAAGVIVLVCGTAPASAATVATVTFVSAYAAAPVVILTPASANAAGLALANYPYVDDAASFTNSFVVKNAGVLNAGTGYRWFYMVMGR